MIRPSDIKDALYFAAKHHDGQYRKGGTTPFIVHPVLVAVNVMRYTDDADVVRAAILHDTIEDCPAVTSKELKRHFGERIACMVGEVSIVCNDSSLPWKDKKQMYLKKIECASEDALLIAAADKMNNMEAYANALQNAGTVIAPHFGGTTDGYRWYYNTIAEIIERRLGKHAIVADYRTVLRTCFPG